jgi:hypothetical protein
MASTEFLLYLVIVIFAVFVIMNYYKNTPAAPEIKYRYIPVHSASEDEESSGSRRSSSHQSRDGAECDNTQCSQAGRCICGEYRLNIDPRRYREPNFPNNMPIRGPGGNALPFPGPRVDPLRQFDHDAVYDDFTPPFRRSYYDEFNHRLIPGLYPTYSRGPPGRFRKIGTLVAQGVSSNDKYKFLNMFGREKYPGRDFEYYAMSINSEQKIKFYIETKGKEISDDDIVNINELEGYLFKFKEDHDLSPRYDPYTV